MKGRKKIDNRKELINAKLRQSEPRFKVMYLQLQRFVEQLEEEKIMKDHNFAEFIHGYSPNKKAHLRTVTSIDEPVIRWDYGLTYMTLYVEDEEYRKSWDTTYPDSGSGWASPFWKSLYEGPRHISFEDMVTLDQIVIGVKIDYQVCVDLNYTWHTKMTDQAKWELLNKKLKEAEYPLKQIIQK